MICVIFNLVSDKLGKSWRTDNDQKSLVKVSQISLCLKLNTDVGYRMSSFFTRILIRACKFQFLKVFTSKSVPKMQKIGALLLQNYNVNRSARLIEQ